MTTKTKQTQEIIEDDDFEFGASDEKKGNEDSDEKGSVGDDNAGDESGDEEGKDKEDTGVSGTDDFGDEKPGDDNDDPGEEKQKDEKSDDEEKEDGDEEKKDKDSIDDFFSDDSDEGDKDKGIPTFDIKDLAKDLDIEAEDVKDFTSKLKDKIEKSKQEFKVDSLAPDAQAIVRHLNENGGTLDDFFINPEISQLQSVIAMDAEDKAIYVTALNYQTGKDKLSPEEAQAKAEEEIKALSTREVRDIADKVDENANGMIKDTVNKIIGDRNTIAEKQRQAEQTRIENEVKNIEKYVETQAEFLGLQLTDKAKQNIVRDIKSGKFDEIANADPVKAKFSAYMFNRFGTKLDEHIKAKMSEANRKGYNAAVDKSVSELHKTPQEAQRKGTARQTQRNDNVKNFDDWSDHFEQE